MLSWFHPQDYFLFIYIGSRHETQTIKRIVREILQLNFFLNMYCISLHYAREKNKLPLNSGI